jgi:protein involved in polysaccharide export with SLBB domain
VKSPLTSARSTFVLRFSLFGLVLALLAVVSIVPGQEAPATGMPSASALGLAQSPLSSLVGVESPIISDKYVLMPGDRLLVTVQGSATYSYDAWITYEGKINVSIPVGADKPEVIDVISVSGLTLAQAQDTLSATMLRYFRTVTVKLTLTGLRSGIVFLTGEVQYPGAYNASPVERVSQVIARAGGLAPLGSKTRIRLIRDGQVHSIADIERFETSGDLLANPFVESGDVIQVPAVEGLVTVKGAVFGRGEYRLRISALTTDKERVSEGIYELKPGERVFDVISKAGGITPWADLSNSYIERLVVGGAGARKKIPVDLRRVVFERDSSDNLEMMNTDIVVIPPLNTMIYVEGEVTKPGSFTFGPNMRAGDYIGQAGGPTNYANARVAYVLRAGRRISVRGNPVVEPGDVVMMPRLGLKWWQDYVSIISAIGIPIASIMITVSLANAGR